MTPNYSVEERVNLAALWLVLIESASRDEEQDADDLSGAIIMAANEARALLKPLKDMPFAVANWHAAREDDEAETQTDAPT